MAKKDIKKMTNVTLKFDEEDYALLKALADKEKLRFSDTIRRAVRHYAAFLNVKLDSEIKEL